MLRSELFEDVMLRSSKRKGSAIKGAIAAPNPKPEWRKLYGPAALSSHKAAKEGLPPEIHKTKVTKITSS